MIVLIVVGGVFVLGAGSCIVVGGLVWLGASAEPDPETGERSQKAAASGAPRGLAGPAASGASTGMAGPSATGAEDPSGTADTPSESDEDDGPSEDDRPSKKAASAPAGKPTAPATATATATAGAPSGKWMCNATGWVRVCGFANVCSNQMVSGIGTGTDRMLASMMAKNACEGMARAKGGSTVCVVSCTVR